MEKKIFLASRQASSYIICAFQDNVRHCGHYRKNYFEYTRCDIESAYVTCSAADFRIPSLPIPTIGGRQTGETGKHIRQYSKFLKHMMCSQSINKSFFIHHPRTGYDFSTTKSQKASYWYALNTFGKLSNSAGTKDFSFESFMKHRFLLPFNLSG